MTHFELDPADPTAQWAAERARAFITARPAGADLADLVGSEQVNELTREKAAYTIAAYSCLAGLILDAYASDLTALGRPIDRADLWAILAAKITAEGHTI